MMRPLRVAICGLGAATQRAHLPALTEAEISEAVHIVALCDNDPSRFEPARSLAPDASVFTDVVEMLTTTEPDLLVIATPPSAHLAAIIAAIERGVDVICEKPLGLNAGDVHELSSLAICHPDRLIATVLQYRHAPAWQLAMSRARAGLANGESVEIVIEVERPGTDPLSAGGWRAHADREGGIIGDHAVHHLGLLDEVASGLQVIEASRHGAGGRETASIEVAGPGVHASVHVTYAGSRRHNRLRVAVGSDIMIWDDDRIAIEGTIQTTGSLSDRDFVNHLYVPWYHMLLSDLANSAARRERTRETLSVARLLQLAVAVSEDSVASSVVEQMSLNSFARAVLLAFADLGIYLPSHRERLLAKIRGLNPLEPSQLQEFINLCIDARLLAPEAAGRLRLSPTEARRLAQSLEGGTPVPDLQARDWASMLIAVTAS